MFDAGCTKAFSLRRRCPEGADEVLTQYGFAAALS
jgi:hypothetical protein